MLQDDVVAAVAAGQFHIWSVETIEQGIEILTGMAAGTRARNGTFPKGTLYHLVDAHLRRMAEVLQKQGEEGKKKLKK
jgi:predicted ATP-dependent protease